MNTEGKGGAQSARIHTHTCNRKEEEGRDTRRSSSGRPNTTDCFLLLKYTETPHLISYSFRASHLVISAVVVFFRMFNFELSAWDGESLRGIARSPFCPSLRTPNDNNKRTEGGRTELGEGRVAKVREREREHWRGANSNSTDRETD